VGTHAVGAVVHVQFDANPLLIVAPSEAELAALACEHSGPRRMKFALTSYHWGDGRAGGGHAASSAAAAPALDIARNAARYIACSKHPAAPAQTRVAPHSAAAPTPPAMPWRKTAHCLAEFNFQLHSIKY
jgi:hypothetical protein